MLKAVSAGVKGVPKISWDIKREWDRPRLGVAAGLQQLLTLVHDAIQEWLRS